jgi:hypothetical protein
MSLQDLQQPDCYGRNPILTGSDHVVTRCQENLRSTVRGTSRSCSRTIQFKWGRLGAAPLAVPKTEGITAMESPKQGIAKRPARCRRARSSLVRRLLQAKDDPAKQRIRRWLSDINDKRLLSFGLTLEEIALLRGSCGSSDFVYLSLLCALCVPSPPGSWF